MPAEPIDLWLVDLDASAAALGAIERKTPRLSAEDRARAATVPDARLRLVAYCALRLIIERTAGASVRTQPFTRDRSGKPRLDGSGVAFNLAHTHAFALIAVTRQATVGVDLEQVRPITMAQHHQDAIRAAGAGLSRAPLPHGETEHRFLQAWARLEALTKARGVALQRTLEDVGVRGRSRGTTLARVRATTRQVAQRAHLAVADLPLPPGLHGAIAAPRLPLRLRAPLLPADRAGLEAVLASTVKYR